MCNTITNKLKIHPVGMATFTKKREREHSSIVFIKTTFFCKFLGDDKNQEIVFLECTKLSNYPFPLIKKSTTFIDCFKAFAGQYTYFNFTEHNIVTLSGCLLRSTHFGPTFNPPVHRDTFSVKLSIRFLLTVSVSISLIITL